MAKAKRITPKHPPRTVRLDLTEKEAVTLLDVVWLVGGEGRTTRRGHTDEILRALEAAGVSHSSRGATPPDVDRTRAAIYFK